MFADAGFSFSAYSSVLSGYSYSYSPVFSHPHPDYSSFFSPSSSAALAQPPLPPLPLLHQQHQVTVVAAPKDVAAATMYHHLGDMGQPSLIAEYDLGAEGDLFKAPEPIIEEPLLTLDPVAAAISMMSGSDNAMNDTIKASDMSLSEALYKCEKELMEDSAIDETISELLDAKIPMLQVEDVPGKLRASSSTAAAAAGECSLQKSVSSGCLNSADWINGSAVQPNLFNFQGLDFEAAFGLRRVYSDGDIQILGANTPPIGIAANVCASGERLVTISDLKSEERKQKLNRYREKKIQRNFGRKIKYACRKALADNQPRVRGRFVKMDVGDMLKPRK
ncbi:GATA transcription factor 20-like [Triticum dicoccoides]|uniref:GATA transcription factor 20-like n=1 Tax=Triticum dicoccoides TaxID=85692 RepID=UPI00188E09E6|nr:GATA transcription factor 20-like [Triticum dicoccoides]XP_044379223.1 GATA transcription factor 20-like [Triticum aestivum]